MADKVNRRRFLEGAAAGGAVLAVATQPHAAEPSAAEKLVVGVMGTGGRGTSLAKQFQSQPNTEVAYVCGSSRFAGFAESLLVESGFSPDAIRVERFGVTG